MITARSSGGTSGDADVQRPSPTSRLSHAPIAARPYITERTVEAHVKQILQKLQLDANPSRTVASSPCSSIYGKTHRPPTPKTAYLPKR